MNGKKISGLILILIGAALIVFSCLISAKVKQGEQKIQRSQRTVNTIRKYSSVSPNAKKIGQMATQPVQQKINQGKQEAAKFQGISIWAFIGGIIIAAVGVVLFVLGFFSDEKPKKRKKR